MSSNAYDAENDVLDILAGTPREQLNKINTELHGSINQLGAKNLLPITAVTTAVSGVTITVNSDGSINANGTASAQIDFTLYSGTDLEAGNYIISKCADDSYYNSSSDFNYVFVLTQGGTSHIIEDEDETLTFTATTFSLVLRIKSGTVLSNKKFYPMIRPSSILDNIWAPYAKTNKVLTGDVESLKSALNVLEKYKLKITTYTTGTSDKGNAGIPLTVLDANARIVSVFCTSADGIICEPYRNTNGLWGIHFMVNTGTTYASQSNVSIGIYYLDTTNI